MQERAILGGLQAHVEDLLALHGRQGARWDPELRVSPVGVHLEGVALGLEMAEI
jgi:hypothetical protein